MRLPVYLDNHATTPVDPRVLEVMLPFFTEQFGNAASKSHEYGWMAEAAVDVARRRIAQLIGAEDDEIIFTSGATESINLALKGVSEGYRVEAGHATIHIVTVATEHHAVLDTCKALARSGVRVSTVPVDSHGKVDPEDVRRAIQDTTVLVSVMWANNEIGTIAPMAEIASICRKKGVLLHSDATQAVGKIHVNVHDVPVDLLSFSAHKMYGPKGIGALYVTKNGRRFPLLPQIDGGGHERGLRSGTLNVPAIVGFGKAAALAAAEQDDDARRIAALRDLLERTLRHALPELRINGHRDDRVASSSSITFPGRSADAMILAMKDIAVSTGSACSSQDPKPSHVLRGIGLTEAEARATLRFGLGRFTTEEEVLYAARRVVEAAEASLTTAESDHAPLNQDGTL
jgi:cysteine desulfurase